MQKYALSEKQANAILDMKLSKLTGLETELPGDGEEGPELRITRS